MTVGEPSEVLIDGGELWCIGDFVKCVGGEWGLDNSDADAGFNTSDELVSLCKLKYLVKAS